MKSLRSGLAALASAALLAACGGGGAGNQATAVSFSSIVTFGDSLSDVGTYQVGTVAALGGGKFTVNGPNGLTWTEYLAQSLHLPAPCAAETGLLPNIPGLVGAPVTEHTTTCTNFAQGSSRVSGIFAPNSASLQASPFSETNIGLMAVPVTNQMASYLSRMGGSYKGTELVTVLAGGNDTFMNLGGVGAAAAGGNGAVGAAIAAGWDASVQSAVYAGGAAAVQAAATAAVTSMGMAGAELAGLVKSQVVGKGAKYVVVVNLPDVSETPFAMSLDANTRGLITQMVTTFNAQLASGLQGTPGVLLVDAYTQGQAQYANPAQYGLTNVTDTACDLVTAANPLHSSLGCTANSLVPGDTSHYDFADSVHPTPYAHQLLSQFVAIQMAKAGWL